ncbi:MAG TPA: VWA domain-containing protein, partial [Acidobacteriota bacterium]|nr:VWA domain-containing protein [Acidobacteriota bacterium]
RNPEPGTRNPEPGTRNPIMEHLPKLELISEYPAIPARSDKTFYVLVQITPPERAKESYRPPLNISLVLDRSGSMGVDKLNQAKQAACSFIDRLLPTDRLSLVTFDTRVQVLVPSTLVTDKQALKAAVAEIYGGSRTALHEAWVRGGLEVSHGATSSSINRVILLTDGIANVGETCPETILKHTSELTQRGITTSTIGIGFDFQEDLLIPMAEAGSGNAFHVVRTTDLEPVLTAEVDNMISQIGHSTRLGFITSSALQVRETLNDFAPVHKQEVRLPNLRAGHPLQIVLAIAANVKTSTRPQTVSIRLTWQAQATGDRHSVNQTLFLPIGMTSEKSAHPEVRKLVGLLTIARIKREAMRQIDAERYAEARQLIFSAIQMTATLLTNVGNDFRLRAQLKALDQLEHDLEQGDDPAKSRKFLAYQSYATSTCRLDSQPDRKTGS